MSTTSQKPVISFQPRRETVVMGRLDFFSVLMRSIGVELYKIRRRMLSKVLSGIMILIMVTVFSLGSANAFFISYSPARALLPPTCSQISSQVGQYCLRQEPNPEEAEQLKREALKNSSQSLRLPDALGTAIQTMRTAGLILIIILAGTIIGGEYGVGTIRLMLTRGPTRAQFFLSKIGAIIVCLFLSFMGLTLLGVTLGAAFNLIINISTDFSFLTADWILHAILFTLAHMSGLFVYAMLAFCLSTIGRATAAGAAGALIWLVLENVLGGVFFLVGSGIVGPFGDFLKAIPDYFIGRNVNALADNQAHFVFGDQPGQLSDIHATSVLLVYTIVFIGLAWWANLRRDITN